MTPLWKIERLTKDYSLGKKTLKAVDSVSLEIQKGETLGLVGESGCGKSTLGKLLLGLVQPTAGEIEFDGKKLGVKRPAALRRRMQMIFQDPYASLNPRMPIGKIIGEPLQIHGLPDSVDELLACVGLSPSSKGRYPHELSGGQRQRVGIARALALRPDFIVCDEPVSALDVSIQAQIASLLQRLQAQFGLTYLLIAHNLAMVRYLSDRVAVMYLGKLVEIASADRLYANPLHPYTQLLLASIPQMGPQRNPPEPAVPAESASGKGCPFARRCPYAQPVCREIEPELKEVEPGRFAACHLLAKDPLKVLRDAQFQKKNTVSI